MHDATPAPILSVIYAKDLHKVADFYRRTLSLALLEEAADFVVLGGAGVEIAVVRMADAIAERVEITSPPRIREETPIKCSFRVDDLQRAKDRAEAAGGAIRPLASAWCWRGQWHLDGHDPEGNVLQFRVAAN
jgi:predicted enzyme related to lactoylglutathione lyase